MGGAVVYVSDELMTILPRLFDIHHAWTVES